MRMKNVQISHCFNSTLLLSLFSVFTDSMKLNDLRDPQEKYLTPQE